MTILTIQELISSIKINIIADICQENPTTFNTGSTSLILDTIENAALSEIKLYIDNYYDFNAIIINPDDIFKQILKDIMIFRLYQRVSADKMPTNVLYNYEQQVKNLQQISVRKINPSSWACKNYDYDKSTVVLWSSDLKINSQF
jgi:hypothetical protein